MRLLESQKNRLAFFRRQKINPQSVVSAELVQGTDIALVGVGDEGKSQAKVDGLITSEKGIVLTITVADCVPVFIHSPSVPAIALIHAGWRGIAGGIMENFANQIQKSFRVQISEFYFGLGPAIGSCHYEVEEDVARSFSQYKHCLEELPGAKYRLNLSRVIIEKLRELSVSENHIEISKICTFEHTEQYFSHRREKLNKPDVMMAYLGMKK